MSDDEGDDEEEEQSIFTFRPSSKQHKNSNRWWSGDEEVPEYDQWSEYIDDDRDNFEPFPIKTDDEPVFDNID